MIAVRRAVAADAPALLRLIRGLADYEKLTPPDDAAQGRLVRDIFGDKPRLEAYLVEVDHVPAGYALVLETYSSFLALPTLYLEDIFVLPEFRGQGAGTDYVRWFARHGTEAAAGWSGWCWTGTG